MRKSILFLAAAVFIAFLSVWILKYIKDINNEENVLLEDAELIEKLIDDKSRKAEKKLVKLSSRRDAVGYLACVELGDRYSERGEDGVPYYKLALELYDTKNVRIKLADNLSKIGKYVEAAEMYASALPNEGALRKLYELPVEPEIIGEKLIEHEQWQKAADFLENEISRTFDDANRLQLEKLYTEALVHNGQYQKSLPVLERLIETENCEPHISMLYAIALEETGQTKKAKDIYRSLGSDGAYRLGLILEKEGDTVEAANAFIQSNQYNSMWKGARLLDEMGQTQKALEIYKKLAGVPGAYQDDAAYRVYVLLKEDKMLDILSGYPAWMERINNEYSIKVMDDINYSKPEFLKRAITYEKSGRSRMAEIEIAIGENNADISSKLALGDFYLSREDYYKAVKYGIMVVDEMPTRHGYELAYPKPYSQYVKEASLEFDIDSYLLWAVMREESRYKSDAFSSAGAIGLMQIMPATGEYIASKLKVEYSKEDLLKPEINIRFGAYYLKMLLNMFNGDVDKALASYNGGSGNVKKWSKSNIGSKEYGFPTAVVFEETREYITKVRNSYNIYKKLYDNAS